MLMSYVSESSSASGVAQLATDLGFPYHHQGSDLAILSMHPIVQTYGSFASGTALSTIVNFNGNKEVFVVSVHYNYQTYMQDPLQEETRRGRMQATLDHINQYAGSRPVIVAGDFNAPSHLDHPDLTGQLRQKMIKQMAEPIGQPVNSSMLDMGMLVNMLFIR